MRVLMVSENYLPTIGGVTRHISSVGRELLRTGHEVAVFCRRRDAELPERETIAGVPVTRFPLDAAPFRAALDVHAAAMRTFDVVHTHDFAAFYRFVMPLLLEHPFLPAFITFHGYEGTFPVSPAVRRLRRACWAAARGSINIGSFIAEWYDTPADVTLFGGVDPPSRAPVPAPREVVCAFIGRLADDQPLLAYVETVARLRRAGIAASLVACGDGPLGESLIAAARAAAVPFRRIAPTYDTEPIRQSARVLFAGGMLSMLEGMASERLVVATAHTDAKRRTVAAAARACPALQYAESPAALAELVARLVRDPAQERAVVLDGRAFAHRHTWDRVAAAYVELWQRAAP